MSDILFVLYIMLVAITFFFAFSRKYDFIWLMDRFDMWSVYFKLDKLVNI